MAAYKLAAGGDSNTSGYSGSPSPMWPTLVDTALEALYPGDTITTQNNAVSGTTTESLVTNFATIYGDESPTVALVGGATNDVFAQTSSNSSPYTTAEIAARLTGVCDDCLALSDSEGRDTQVILMPPPPAIEAADLGGNGGLWTVYLNRTYIEALRDALEAYAAVTDGVTFVDIYQELVDSVPNYKTSYLNGPGSLQGSGVHLNQAGEQFVADLITAATVPLFTPPGRSWALPFDIETEVGDFATLRTLLRTEGAFPTLRTLTEPRGPHLPLSADFVSAQSQTADFISAREQTADFVSARVLTADFVSARNQTADFVPASTV